MATRVRLSETGQQESELINAFSPSMSRYLEPKHYLQHNVYHTSGQSFVKDKFDKHSRRDEIRKELKQPQSEVLIDMNSYARPNQAKVQLTDGSLIKGFMANTFGNPSSLLNDDRFNSAQFLVLANDLPAVKPLLFLQSPGVRHGTDTSTFRKFPCSGGIKGPAAFHQPGSKLNVKWQIESPVKDGQCAVKLAQNNDQNPGSYVSLKPDSKSIDANGYFSCGDLNGSPEYVTVTIPQDSS